MRPFNKLSPNEPSRTPRVILLNGGGPEGAIGGVRARIWLSGAAQQRILEVGDPGHSAQLGQDRP
jgi:hypothetical protein